MNEYSQHISNLEYSLLIQLMGALGDSLDALELCYSFNVLDSLAVYREIEKLHDSISLEIQKHLPIEYDDVDDAS